MNVTHKTSLSHILTPAVLHGRTLECEQETMSLLTNIRSRRRSSAIDMTAIPIRITRTFTNKESCTQMSANFTPPKPFRCNTSFGIRFITSGGAHDQCQASLCSQKPLSVAHRKRWNSSHIFTSWRSMHIPIASRSPIALSSPPR